MVIGSIRQLSETWLLLYKIMMKLIPYFDTICAEFGSSFPSKVMIKECPTCKTYPQRILTGESCEI